MDYLLTNGDIIDTINLQSSIQADPHSLATIILYDGREFDIDELMYACNNNRRSINLRTGVVHVPDPDTRRGKIRYTHEDRVWIATAKIKDIMVRFNVSAQYVHTLVTRTINQLNSAI